MVSYLKLNLKSNGFEILIFSLLGGFSVPAKFYPWVVLLISQFIMPGVSFIGHLCGMFAGYFYVYFLFKKAHWDWICTKLDNFVPALIKNQPSFMALQTTLLPMNTSAVSEWLSRARGNESATSNEGDTGNTFQGRGRVLGHQ